MPAVRANGLEIEVERTGDPRGEPILLVRGLGSQLIHWPAELVAGLAARGFHVVTFDNRDSGLSQKIEPSRGPRLENDGDRAGDDAPHDPPYTLSDMAADGAGVLDALGIDSAHVLGISMGGKIAQRMAAEYPDRVRSATIVMSSSGAPGLPEAASEIRAMLVSEPQAKDRESVVAHWLRCDKAWASPKYPFNRDARQALYQAAYDRCYCPEGVARQYAAIRADRDRFEWLAKVRAPALVIHGTDDTIFPVEHGRDIASRIPNCTYLEIEGMGHDLEGPVPELIAGHVAGLADRAQGAVPPARVP